MKEYYDVIKSGRTVITTQDKATAHAEFTVATVLGVPCQVKKGDEIIFDNKIGRR
jgi:ASC-1-like (ASCH) protein